MNTFESNSHIVAAEKNWKFKTRKDLNAKGHTKRCGRRTQFDRKVLKRAPCPRYRTCFQPCRENHSFSRLPRNARRSGYALGSLSEATAMWIVAGRSVRNHFQQRLRLRFVQSRTTRPPLGHGGMFGMIVPGMIVAWHCCHLMPGTHVHGEHRGHRHLGPGRYDHQQKCRNSLFRHTNSSLPECRPPPSDPDHTRV
jgi:hypothetical protein